VTGPYAQIGQALDVLNEVVADWSVDLLRRQSELLSHGYDHAAQRDIEGARDWHDLARPTRFPNE
jgi:hypothetical protein